MTFPIVRLRAARSPRARTARSDGGPRIGLLTNPRSTRNKKTAPEALKPLLAENSRVLHRLAEGPQQIEAALSEFAAQGVDVVAANGGDGTVHATLDGLLDRGIFDVLPLVAVLPGGRTNMTANDVGVRGDSPLEAAQRLLAWKGPADESARVVTRNVIHLEGARGGRPRNGLFFAAAGVFQAAENCWAFRDASRVPGMKTGLGTAVSIASQVVGHLLHRGPLRPTPIRLDIDGDRGREHEYLVLFVTTLERMALGIRPFWDAKAAPLRLTAVSFAHRHLLRATPSLLRGKPNGLLTRENGFMSRNAHSVTMDLKSGCMLDGEIIHPDWPEPIRLSAERSVRFLRL